VSIQQLKNPPTTKRIVVVIMGNSTSKKDGGGEIKPTAEMFQTPINVKEDDNNDDASSDPSKPKSRYPTPTGQEYDVIDRIAAELPNVIDDESKQQVLDYLEACDDGKGPVVACFAAAEYLSLFERKHKKAAELYQNVCHRPKTDKSPNSVEIDGTKAYPAGCFNLAKVTYRTQNSYKTVIRIFFQCTV